MRQHPTLARDRGWQLITQPLPTDTNIEYPGKEVARAHEADHQGGILLTGALVANTLDELRSRVGRGSDPGYMRNVEFLGWRGSGHFRCNP